MWLFTSIGFFSVVEDEEHSGALKIRARAQEDLEALRDRYLPDLEILRTEHTDYRFRAVVARDEWAHAAQALATDIDYPNFKAAVAQRQGSPRAKRYGRVWELMHGLQREAEASSD
jgi:hypothetical protein